MCQKDQTCFKTDLKNVLMIVWAWCHFIGQRGRPIPQSRFYHITRQINPGFAVTLGFLFQKDHGMLVAIETYALNQTWSDQVLRRLSLKHNPVLGI